MSAHICKVCYLIHLLTHTFTRHEDELRVEHLQGMSIASTYTYRSNSQLGDDSVFDDLKISKNDYPKVPTTW